MNIFFLDTSPFKAAQYLCDKHLSKMQLESAQMLSTAVHVLCPDADLQHLYKKTHVSHPSAVWVRQSYRNATWLYDHIFGMHCEWQARGHSEHKSYQISVAAYSLLGNVWPRSDRLAQLTDVPLCMPDECRDKLPKHVPIAEAVAAYRKYYREHKAYMAKWPENKIPYWW